MTPETQTACMTTTDPGAIATVAPLHYITLLLVCLQAQVRLRFLEHFTDVGTFLQIDARRTGTIMDRRQCLN